jgi:hypothetical protein
MKQIETLFTPTRETDFSTGETLSLIGLAALAAVVISWIPIVNILDYPLQLMLTLVHELGHGLTAIITGGSFHNFRVAPDGSGVAFTSGGWRLLIIPAGYLSVAIFAAALISLGRTHRRSRIALGIIGVAMIVFSLCFGRPAEASIMAVGLGVLTIMIGCIFGALFLRTALKASAGVVIFLLHLVAIKAGLTAFTDLFGLFGITINGSFGAQINDAANMAALTHLPAFFWALVWIGFAVVIIGAAIKLTWFTGNNF